MFSLSLQLGRVECAAAYRYTDVVICHDYSILQYSPLRRASGAAINSLYDFPVHVRGIISAACLRYKPEDLWTEGARDGMGWEGCTAPLVEAS